MNCKRGTSFLFPSLLLLIFCEKYIFRKLSCCTENIHIYMSLYVMPFSCVLYKLLYQEVSRDEEEVKRQIEVEQSLFFKALLDYNF